MITIVYKILRTVLSIYNLAVLVRIIMSWFPVSGIAADIYDVLFKLTEPVLAPIRRMLMKIRFFSNLPIDFSPIVLMIILSLIMRLLAILFFILI